VLGKDGAEHPECATAPPRERMRPVLVKLDGLTVETLDAVARELDPRRPSRAAAVRELARRHREACAQSENSDGALLTRPPRSDIPS
jgi:hypothetical protein